MLLRAALILLPVALLFWFTDPVPQDQAYMLFADNRRLLGVANFWNVASNLPFLLVGIWGLTVSLRYQPEARGYAIRRCYQVLFLGVLLTAFGSSWFHLAPANDPLVWDRLPMTIAFAGLFAAVIGEYISPDTANRYLPVFLVIGVCSVLYWQWTETRSAGDLRPYAIVQFLPVLAIPLILAFRNHANDIGIFLWLNLGVYVVAKAFEFYDPQVFSSLGFMSGHAIKHVVAAIGPMLIVIGLQRRQAQVLLQTA
jgi:hypothetical protein